MPTLLSIDLGTSSVKVALIDSDTLKALAVSTIEYAMYHPQDGFAEQSPSEWWQATVKAVGEVVQQAQPQTVEAIGLSGQMHGLVLLDDQHQPVQNAIIWADGRSTKQVQLLQKQQPQFDATLSGLPAVGFAASSALWLKMNQPDVLSKTYQWCLPKDYINFKLTGTVATEPSDAASTWLFDIRSGEWAMDVASYCGLDASQMPPVVPSTSIIGHLTNLASEALGLPAGIPVVAGSADLPSQGLGQGITSPETALITVGTGGQIFVPTRTMAIDNDYRYYVLNHNLADTWYVQAAILSGGLALRWLRDILGMADTTDAYQQLSAMASEVPAGADGLLFLPYLAGERSPHMDAEASGMFFGLRLSHGAAHLVRAVMEGVAFAIRDCLSYIPQQAIKRYVLSGGITQSEVWSQILADVLEQPLLIESDNQPHGCLGAAILAGIGVGIYADIGDVEQRYDRQLNAIQPLPSSIYKQRFQQYLSLYPLLKDDMHTLNAT